MIIKYKDSNRKIVSQTTDIVLSCAYLENIDCEEQDIEQKNFDDNICRINIDLSD